jgi:hypothetical protein
MKEGWGSETCFYSIMFFWENGFGTKCMREIPCGES